MTPKIKVTDVGYLVPTTEEVNNGTWDMLDQAYGGNLSRVQGTPQYQLNTSWTAVIVKRLL